jgi:hypothetical protein
MGVHQRDIALGTAVPHAHSGRQFDCPWWSDHPAAARFVTLLPNAAGANLRTPTIRTRDTAFHQLAHGGKGCSGKPDCFANCLCGGVSGRQGPGAKQANRWRRLRRNVMVGAGRPSMACGSNLTKAVDGRLRLPWRAEAITPLLAALISPQALTDLSPAGLKPRSDETRSTCDSTHPPRPPAGSSAGSRREIHAAHRDR